MIGVARRKLHMKLGYALPTIDLHADFSAVSRLPDRLDFSPRSEELGRRSRLSSEVSSAGERRSRVGPKQVLVDVAETRFIAWPDDWRARIQDTIT